MNIIILGAGEIGFHLAENLSSQAHNICVIERDEQVAADIGEKLDARIVQGNGASVSVLEEANVTDCDVFLSLTSGDNTNIVAASLAKSLGAKKSIARVHVDVQQDQWLYDFRKHFQIDYIFSSERLAAVELAKFIRNPEHLLVEEIARGRIELQQFALQPSCEAAGRMLRDLKLPPRVRVGSIQREGKILVPSADEVLRGGDVITIFGSPHKLQEVRRLFQRNVAQPEQQRVAIFGGGAYGFALAQMLTGGKFRVRIFEKDKRRCEYLAKVLQNTTVLNADATSARVLKEEQLEEADFFVGASTDDEDNVMTCLQAKDLGVKNCLALVHRADYMDTIMRTGPRIGIRGAVSPRVATSRDLNRFLTKEKYATLARLEGDLEIIEFPVTEKCALVGKRVVEVKWPLGTGLVSLTHGSTASVPAADDVFAVGDIVSAIVSPEVRREFLKLVS